MSGALAHSPSEIIQNLMVDLGLGVLPSVDGSWPIYRSGLPEDPDNTISVIRTAGRLQGRRHPTGETIEHYGIQITVRGTTPTIGDTKVRAIADSFDTNVLRDSVTIGSDVYVVQSINRASGPIPLGNETPESKRQIFTLNITASIRQNS